MRRVLAVWLLASCFALVAQAGATTTYDTFGGYSGGWLPFGYSNTATYGETFAAPSNGDTQINDFSLFLHGGSGNIEFAGYLATWTGTQAGTILYSSNPVTFVGGGAQQFTFNTGGIDLTPGGEYVAFLSISDYYGQTTGGGAQMPFAVGSTPGGNFVFYNNGGNFASLTNSSWDCTNCSQVAFVADFSAPTAVPEPSGVYLVGTGLAGLLSLRRRRR